VSGLLLRSVACGPEERPQSVIVMDTAPSTRSWMETSIECGGSQHFAIVTICLAVLLLLSLICLTLVMTAAQRSPVSRSWLAKVSGRNDVAVVLGKLLLSIITNTIAGPAFDGTWVTIVPVLLLSIAWFAGSLVYQPYQHVESNAAVVAGFATFMYAQACAGAALVWPDYEWSATVVIGCVMAAILGRMATTTRNDSIVQGRIEDVSTEHEMQAWIKKKGDKLRNEWNP